MMSNRPGVRALTGAVLVTVLTNMPVFLIGALAIEILRGTHAAPSAIGLAVGAYWSCAAISSTGAGQVSRLLGERGLGTLAVSLAVLSLGGTALFSPECIWMVIWAAVGGVSNGFGHPSSNHSISLNVSNHRRGLAFGAKQAAVPMAGLVAGLSVPLIALTLGWQWVFALGGVFGVLLLAPALTSRKARVSPAIRRKPLDRRQRMLFMLMAVMTALAAGAANSTVAFAVTGAVERGVGAAGAGLLLAAASLLGVILRLFFGELVDKRNTEPLTLVMVITFICGTGLLIMSIPSATTYILGYVLAGGIGWSWPGLIHFTVSRLAPHATVGATGLVQSGSYAGSAIGPIVTGALLAVDASLAWAVLGIAAMCAAATAVGVRKLARLL